jgi:hypothetical protein
MVFKPTGDDTWTLAILAVIFVLSVAFFLGRARALSRRVA